MDSKDKPKPQGRAVESWLHKQAGPAYDALKANGLGADSQHDALSHWGISRLALITQELTHSI